MPGLGQFLSEKSKQKVSDSLKGHKVSEETKQRISLALIGRALSEEHKRNIGKGHLGLKHPKIAHRGWGIGFYFSNGYPVSYVPEHPSARANGYVLVSRLIAEKALGRFLRKEEEVHHNDLDTQNNVNDNLLVCTREYHAALHAALRAGTRMYKSNS